MGVEGFKEIATLIINNDSDIDHLKDRVGEILSEDGMYVKEKTSVRSNIEALSENTSYSEKNIKNTRCIEKD